MTNVKALQTTTSTKIERRGFPKKAVIIVSVILTAAVAAGLIIGIFHMLRSQRGTVLTLQQEMLAELDNRPGEYDAQSIALYNTNGQAARELAEKLGAKLRMTENEKFATLTLPEGMTVYDVYSNDEYVEDLSKMSTDWRVSLSEISYDKELSSNTAKRLPTRPRYSQLITDDYYPSQSYLDYMNLSTVWNKTKGYGVTVAVIDTGIDTDHPEFAGRISEYSYNASEDKIVKDYDNDWSLIEDEQGHGTKVTGVLAASMNENGVVGIAPEVKIIVIKADCDEKGRFRRTSDLVYGLYYAIERDANVVNMSFDTRDDKPFIAPLRLAVDSDIICVAAAGNESSAMPVYPASDPNCIGVGALAADSWELADYSNFGDNSDIVAPGTTLTTVMDGGYSYESGTSFASPAVTGAIALYLSQSRHTEYKDLQEVLFASCYDLGDLGEDFYYGYGAVDVSALVLEERGKVTFDYLTDEIDNTEQTFIRNHTLQNIPLPERLYAIFDGWYYDDQMTEEYHWYEDKFSTDLTLYANWVNEDDGVPYTYVELEDGTIEIRSYTGRRRYIVMPTYIDGKVVSSIGEEALKGQTNIRQVTLPSKLVSIRREAFSNCINLVSILIPDTVTDIGEYAFLNDVRMSLITFGSGSQLKAIGNYAFKNCTKLGMFEVQKNVINLNGSAFFGCTNMTFFSVVSGNTAFKAENGVLFNKSGDTVVAYPAGVGGEYAIPASIRTIGKCAFGYAKISVVDLSNVTTIEESAFEYSMLENVNIPDSVTEIGKSAFANNDYLKTAQLGRGLSKINATLFQNDKLLLHITITNKITDIGAGSFQNAGLRSVTFEENATLKAIDQYAFHGCEIENIIIPKSTSQIGDSAFRSNPLASVVFEENSMLETIGDYAFMGCSLSAIVLPSKLEILGEFSFSSNPLVSVTIPASVSDFGAGSFAYCTKLIRIHVETENENYKDVNGIVFSKDGKILIEYSAGRADSSYTVPDGAEEVWKYAFCGSENLYNIYLPESLTNIHEAAFQDVCNLGEIKIPKNVEQIGRLAFAEDYNLKSISIPDDSKIVRIDFQTFAYCGIRYFTVPTNVSTIAQYAFEGCSNLEWFKFAANSILESISAYMLDGCDNLKSIKFMPGSKLTSIQAHGLEGMKKLNDIDFGDAKIKTIGNYAFRYCESLAKLNLPEGTEYIGRYAFYQCKSLSDLMLPASLEYIGRFAFFQTNEAKIYFAADTLPETLQEDWDFGTGAYFLGVVNVVDGDEWKYAELTNGGIALAEYKGNEKSIDLSNLNFSGDVYNIGGKLFRWSGIEEIVIPDTVKIIQNEAFYHSNLKSLSLPASVTFIGQKAFEFTPIETITIGNGSELKTIEESAFKGTKNLKNVTIPKSVTVLGRAVFKNSGLTSLTFEKGIDLKEIPKDAFAYTSIKTLDIPDSIKVIGDNAFRQTEKLESLRFGSNQDLKIRSNAFYQSGIKTLSIPAGVTYIGEYSFVALNNLQTIAVDENNPYYKSIDGLLVSKDGRKLISVPAGRTGTLTVPDGVEVIGFGAFENSKLTAVSFKSDANILSFGYRAFFGMNNLKEISIPETVVAIDYFAFAYCENLEKVTFADGSKLTGVYEGAFCGDIRLSNIELPDTVVEISDYAFYGCESLTSIPVTNPENLKGIYSYAFAYTGITGDFTVPESVLDIGDYAFMGISAEKITVPDTNKEKLIIGIGAFEACSNLNEITLPFIGASLDDEDIHWFGYVFGAGIKTNRYFSSNDSNYSSNKDYIPESLKTVNITEGQTFVYTGAFYGITSIDTVNLPKSIVEVYEYAFYDTTFKFGFESKITLKYIENCKTHTLSHLGSDNYIDFGHHFAYLQNTNVTKIRFSDSLKKLGKYALQGCESLTYVEFPDSEVEIGERAFFRCTSLTDINIGGGVTTIGGFAFDKCENLSNVVIGDSVVEIGERAFYNLKNLQSVTFGKNVSSIGEWAFDHCTGLTSITLPESVTYVGLGAFNNCKNLMVLHNHSSVNVGKIAYKNIDKDGNITYGKFPYSGYNTEYMLTDDGFLFEYNYGTYKLKFCYSEEETVTLPADINGETYYISMMKGFLPYVKKVIIPQGVEIGGDGFFNCSGLTEIVLPDGLTEISNYAFYGCTSLKTINIPESVNRIGQNAFSGCDSITELYIPGSVSYVDSWTFLGYMKNLNSLTFGKESRFSLVDGMIYDTALNGLEYQIGDKKNVVIPEGVKSISAYAFQRKKELESVVIPDSVYSIGDYAFESCLSLKSVVIPDSVISIGYGAFAFCRNLKSVTLPKGITNLNFGYFMDCSSLVSINIPDGVTELSLSGCSSLTDLTLPDSIEALYLYGCSSLINVNIPNGVKQLSLENCSRITSVRIPEGIISFNLSGCRNLKCVELPAGLEKIGDHSISGCTSLTDIIIPEGVTSIDERAFYNCSGLKSVKLPDSLREIKAGAFCECTGLASITIPGGVTSIDGGAFSGCTGLESITIPDRVTLIGDSAFSYCTALKSITIPNGVSGIDSNAFYGCSSLVSINIPESITDIGDNAFANCSSLISVSIPSGVTVINSFAFAYSGLTHIDLPDSITYIDDYAFYNCANLSSFSVPKNVTDIGGDAFGNCERLFNVYNNSYLPISIGDTGYGGLGYYALKIIDRNGTVHYINDGYKYIETDEGFIFDWKDGAYRLRYYIGDKDTVTLPLTIEGKTYEIYQFTGAENVIIPEGITVIGDKAFSGAYDLKSVVIPDGVTEFGSYAFSGCIGLSDIAIPESVTSIGNGAFSGCRSLVAITMPDSVTTIGEGAFSGCIGLTNIEIPDNMTTIGGGAFSGCIGLTNIEIPDNVTMIGGDAFSGCTGLVSIVLPQNLADIGESTFENCIQLKTIKIPDSVSSIGEYAFKNTAAYNDENNWEKGHLYIDGWLIAIDGTVKYTDLRSDARGISDGVYNGNTIVKFTYGDCTGTSNVETMVIWSGGSYSLYDLPITFKNVIIAERSDVIFFGNISGITIYVEAEEKDCRWDELYPGWSNGNRVIYGDDWAYSEFYDVDGKLIFKVPRANSKVIIHPYYRLESDAQYEYKTGWDIDEDGVEDAIPATSTENIQAKAIITERTLRSYTVRFVDYDGSLLGSGVYYYGEMPEVPADPTRMGNEAYRYSFTGWSQEVSTVTGDETYMAVYDKEFIEYTITFKNDDGTVISETKYHYGDTVTLPAEPAKPADEQHVYAFESWVPNVTSVTGSATYTAVYKETPRNASTEIVIATANGGQNGESTILIPSDDKNTLSEITSATAAPDYVLGDINGDGDIDGRDYIVVKKYVLGTADLTDRQLEIADINGDGEVDGIDYLLIKKHVLGTYTIPEPQPVEADGPDYADFAVIVVDANGKVQTVKQADGNSKSDLSVPNGGYAIAIPKAVLDANAELKNTINNLTAGGAVTLFGVSLNEQGVAVVLTNASVVFSKP